MIANETLQLNIAPAQAITDGAQWRYREVGNADWSPWRDSGWETDIYAASFEIEFKDTTSGYWIKPNMMTITIATGEDKIINATYTGYGFLYGTILPEAAVNAGAQWCIDNGNWQNSGTTLDKIPVGNHIVSFKTLAGWIEPAAQSVTVNYGSTTEFCGEYKTGPEQTATVKGQVLESSSDSPLWNVRVRLVGNVTYELNIKPEDNGCFTFENIALNQTYTCTVSSADYDFTPTTQNITVQSSGVHYLKNVFYGTLTLKPIYSISGKVINSNGKGVYRARVTAGGKAALTNSLGFYRISNLMPGEYDLILQSMRAYKAISYHQAVAIKDNSVSGVNFDVYPANLKISGTVFKGDGRSPLNNIQIHLIGSANRITKTDSKGKFSFNQLTPGSYSVIPTNPTNYTRSFWRVTLVDNSIAYCDFTLKVIEKKELDVGKLTIRADRITGYGNKYTAKGNVRIGNLLFADTAVSLDTKLLTISGKGRLYTPSIPKLGSLTLYDGSFNIRAASILNNIPDIRFFGFSFSINDVEIKNDGIYLDATLGLPNFIKGVSGARLGTGINITSTGAELKRFDGYIDKIELAKTWQLRSTQLTYKKSSSDNYFTAGTGLYFPITSKGISGDFTLKNGNIYGFHLYAQVQIPLYGGTIYITKLGGGLEGLGGPGYPFIDAALSLSAGPKIGRVAVVETNLETQLRYPDYFSGRGQLLVLTYPIARALVEYSKGDGVWIEVDLNFFSILWVDGYMDIDNRGVSGAVNAKIGVPIEKIPKFLRWLFGKKDLVFAGISGNFGASGNKAYLKTSTYLLLFTLRTQLDNTGFQFSTNGRKWHYIVNNQGRTPPLSDLINPEKSELEFKVPDDLYRAVFMTNWEKGDTEVQLIDPSGNTFTKSDNSRGIEFFENKNERYAIFVAYSPEPGEWKINFTNKNNIGEYFTDVSLDDKNPGIVITEVTDLGGNKIKINWEQTADEEAAVDLQYGRSTGSQNKRLIATSADIGTDQNSYIWDISTIPPGNYYVYASIRKEGAVPMTARSNSIVKVEGNPSYDTVSRPKVKVTSKDDVSISWKYSGMDQVDYFKVYFTSGSKQQQTTDHVTVPGGRRRLLLDGDTIKSGRKYKLNISAVLLDGTETRLSKPARFTYRTKMVNNPPLITSLPDDKVKFDEVYTYKAKASDMDKDKIYFALKEAPDGMTVDYITGLLKWKPEEEQTGSHKVVLEAADEAGATDTQQFTLTVINPDSPGSLEIREIHTEKGTGILILYSNGNLNTDGRKIDTIIATTKSGQYNAPLSIELRENDHDSGIFSVYLSPEKVDNLKRMNIPFGPVSNSDFRKVNLTFQLKDGGQQRRIHYKAR